MFSKKNNAFPTPKEMKALPAEKQRYWEGKMRKIANPELNKTRVLQYLAGRVRPGRAEKRPADDQSHRSQTA